MILMPSSEIADAIKFASDFWNALDPDDWVSATINGQEVYTLTKREMDGLVEISTLPDKCITDGV